MSFDTSNKQQAGLVMDTTKVTSGVRISVKSLYRNDLSDPNEFRFFFNYLVKITNENEFDIKLLTRDWYVFDSLGEATYISGAGVIGEQPILKKGDTFEYSSGCELSSEIGFMKGFYTFLNIQSNDHFEAIIPPFSLESPSKLN